MPRLAASPKANGYLDECSYSRANPLTLSLYPIAAEASLWAADGIFVPSPYLRPPFHPIKPPQGRTEPDFTRLMPLMQTS